MIQSSLRNELGKDVTVITVAHRLQTIMDADKIVCSSLSIAPRLVLTSFLDGFGCRAYSALLTTVGRARFGSYYYRLNLTLRTHY